MFKKHSSMIFWTFWRLIIQKKYMTIVWGPPGLASRGPGRSPRSPVPKSRPAPTCQWTAWSSAQSWGTWSGHQSPPWTAAVVWWDRIIPLDNNACVLAPSFRSHVHCTVARVADALWRSRSLRFYTGRRGSAPQTTHEITSTELNRVRLLTTGSM